MRSRLVMAAAVLAAEIGLELAEKLVEGFAQPRACEEIEGLPRQPERDHLRDRQLHREASGRLHQAPHPSLAAPLLGERYIGILERGQVAPGSALADPT